MKNDASNSPLQAFGSAVDAFSSVLFWWISYADAGSPRLRLLPSRTSLPDRETPRRPRGLPEGVVYRLGRLYGTVFEVAEGFRLRSLSQLRDLPLPLVLDAAALAAVLLFLFLPLGGLVDRLQAVLVEDLQLGQLGFGLAADVGDLLPQLIAEGLLPRPLDALLLQPLEGQLVGRLHSGCLVLVRHDPRIPSRAKVARVTPKT